MMYEQQNEASGKNQVDVKSDPLWEQWIELKQSFQLGEISKDDPYQV